MAVGTKRVFSVQALSIGFLLFCHFARTEDRFTALKAIEEAFGVQKFIVKRLHEYIASERDRLQLLTRLAEKLEGHNESAADLELKLSDPVTAYLTVKDLFADSSRVAELLSVAEARVQQLNSSFMVRDWLPEPSDLQGAAQAVMRIQDTYLLTASSLADGSFSEGSRYFNAEAKLNADDCFHIGKTAYEDEDHYHAVLWLTEALNQLPADDTKTASKRTEIRHYLAFSLHEQGNTKMALRVTEDILEADPNNARYAAENIAFYRSLISQQEVTSPVIPELTLQRPLFGHQQSEIFETYEQLCRHEPVKAKPMKRDLRCRYLTRNHPLLIYSPAMEEELNLNPRVMFFHHVMTDYEVEVIKNLSTPLLHRSGVVTSVDAAAHADYRTSQSAWLDDTSDPQINKIAKRIAAIAGLNGNTAEALQVLNYGIGGQYEPHVDYSDESLGDVFLKGAGNRISTFLNYLSDVEAGGATVFPRLGVAVQPEKGGALMWYNLLRNGKGDELSLHAACPVLLGYKWVANKWFHEAGNEFVRQCALNKDL